MIIRGARQVGKTWLMKEFGRTYYASCEAFDIERIIASLEIEVGFKIDLLQVLDKNDFDMMKIFKTKYVDCLKYYYYVGGMPEVVSDFVKNRDFKRVRNIQNKLLFEYENDLSKHALGEIVTRIRMLWNSIPTQLAEIRTSIWKIKQKEGTYHGKVHHVTGRRNDQQPLYII